MIIITHDYDDRCGVRYLPNGLKVYYIPSAVVYSQSTFPTLISMFPSLRSIWIREDIDLVHGHQVHVPLAHACFFSHYNLGIFKFVL